ncbi:pyrroline-5-carboxylate reductase dimerization domain-containing protein [Paraburkholderia sp. EG287B]|uniref:pyrroline-5-carboxylate reductase dimerization domain-containing protein n=1 Tax=Paraburkholderia sp. EG287B TaxID=3237010 RepID=UPI0034D28481
MLATMNVDCEILMHGCGKVGYAMLQGWVAAKVVPPNQISVVEPADDWRHRAGLLGVHCFASVKALSDAAAPDAVVITGQSPDLETALPQYRALAPRAVFISVAAGVTVARIEGVLGGATSVICAASSMPVPVGQGSPLMYVNKHVSGRQLDLSAALVRSCGSVRVVDDESQIDTATPISGSVPAYVFYLIECLQSAGQHQGLPGEMALALACERADDAARLAMAAGVPQEKQRRHTTSPYGTIAAALSILMANAGL